MSINIDKGKIETLEVIDGSHIKCIYDLNKNTVTINVIDVAEKNHEHDIATEEKSGFISPEEKKKLKNVPIFSEFKECYNMFYGLNPEKIELLTGDDNKNNFDLSNYDYKQYKSSEITINDTILIVNLDKTINNINAFIGIDVFVNGIHYFVKTAKIVKEDNEVGYNKIYLVCNEIFTNIFFPSDYDNSKKYFKNFLFEIVVRYIGN